VNPYAGTLDQAPSWFTTTDGYRLVGRVIHADDAPRLIDLFDQLSSETRRRRFHLNVDNLSEEVKRETARRLAEVDNRTLGGAVLAIDVEDRGRIVGVARLGRAAGQPDSPEAEAAIVVRDDFQGRGVGRELLRRLVLLAKQMRVQTIVAVIEMDNLRALRAFRELGLPTETVTRRGETILHIAVPK
jgi:acetyltransferase